MTQDDSSPEHPTVVDARGHRCPTPTLRLRRALETARVGTRLVLLADDPLARIDVPHLVTTLGHELLDIADRAGAIRFTVRKKTPAAAGE